MDAKQVTEKLFNFCQEKYPDLKWIELGYDQDCIAIQGGTSLASSSEIKILLRVGSSFFLARESQEEWEGIKGWCTLDSLDWVGEFIVLLNSSKKSEFCFYTETVDEWSEKDWLLCKQIQKIMLDIFNFILDEIQE